jgi:DNA-binding IclR family transcriptional regulator
MMLSAGKRTGAACPVPGLECVRRRRYAVDDEEIEIGARCVGAPIFDESETPVAAMNASGSTPRIQARRVAVIAAYLMGCCRRVSSTLQTQWRA